MLDYQRIVDDLRSSLSCYCAEGDDFLRAAAADYSVACDEVNERLHQCGELLRRGLRSEAIQVANIEPNLLDAVALLDFPERAEMAEAARSCGLAPPSPLLLDSAAGLNEAYALEEPLAATLQEHRILALARGTLRAHPGLAAAERTGRRQPHLAGRFAGLREGAAGADRGGGENRHARGRCRGAGVAQPGNLQPRLA